MMKNLFWIAIAFWGMVLCFTELSAQSLHSASTEGTGTTTSDSYSMVGTVSVTVDVTSAEKVLVIATFTSKTTSGASIGAYRIADNNDNNINSGEFQLTHSGKDGIGTIVHIFDVSSSGNKTYEFQHQTTDQTLNTSATLTAIVLYDETNHLTSDIQQLASPIPVNDSDWVGVVSNTNFSLPAQGGIYVAASIQNQKTSGGSEVVSGEWVLQYKKTADTQWKDMNYPVFRSPLGEQIGMVSLVGALPNNTAAGDYDFRVAHRRITAPSDHKIVTQACNLVVVALGTTDGYFPVLATTRPSASTTSTSLVPVIETVIKPQTDTDIFVHTQYALRSSGTTDPCTHDIQIKKDGTEVGKSINYLKFIANNSHRCSGSASFLFKNMLANNQYNIDFRHASRPGRSMTTSETYMVILGLNRSLQPFVSPITVFATEGLTSASYSTLKEAFDYINSGLFRGEIIIHVNANTTETAASIIDASGTGSANYSSILIYPTAPNLSISGDIAASLIHFRGAENITIDGRVNQIGEASLEIKNESTNASSRTIRFEGSAQNNTLRYLNIKGSTPSTNAGVIFFSNSSSGTGNNNNIIEYCNITNAGQRPTNLLYSAGTAGRRNSGNIIRNNHFFNFLSTENWSNGINIVSNSENWLIDGNHFYDTETIAPTDTRGYSCIRINTNDVNNYTISNNYFGGTEPYCGGGRWTIAASTPHFMRVISLNLNNTSGTSTISNNSIRGFDYTSTGANPFDGIYLFDGSIHIENNTIGNSTGTESIVLKAANAYLRANISGGSVSSVDIVGSGFGFSEAPEITFNGGGGSGATATTTINGSGEITSVAITNAGTGYTSSPQVRIQGVFQTHSTFHGIWLRGAGTKTIKDNIIGSINTIGSNAYVYGFEGIYHTAGSSGSTEISNNKIGSLETENNIQSSSSGKLAATGQRMYGIYTQNDGNSHIHSNTISNITNSYSGSDNNSATIGIYSNRGTNIIENNSVSNLKTYSENTGGASSASIYGIGINRGTHGFTHSIKNNKISNISNENQDARVDAFGIFFQGSNADWSEVSGNLVQNIKVQSANIQSSVIGIYLFGGKTNFHNNIIHLGKDFTNKCLIYGVYDWASWRSDLNCYFNTVLIEGSVSEETASSFAFFNRTSSSTPRNIKNNLFINTRSGGTSGKHYAVRVGTASNLSIDYNNYHAPNGVLGWLGSDRTDLDAWKTATSQDANSYSADPEFASTGSNHQPFYPSIQQNGVTVTGIDVDFTGQTRSETTPKIGALEINEIVWQGGTNTDFNTASNWVGDIVPGSGASIRFADNPDNDCHLDQDKTFGSITNPSSKNLVLNGKKATVKGELNFSSTGVIDGTVSSSAVEFAGIEAQTIPAGIFADAEVDGLIVNNAFGVTMGGDLSVNSSLELTSGNLSIGTHTLTIIGTITQTSDGLTGGISSNIVVKGSGANATLPEVVLNNLTLNRSNGLTMGGNLTVNGTLALDAGTLTTQGNKLTISGGSPTGTGGVNASNSSATIEFTSADAIVLPSTFFADDVQNLTLSGSGGITAASDFTVNGVLNLQSSNPSSTKGILDLRHETVTSTLTMGENATTIGIGDVTGKVKRTTIEANTNYTFGSQFSNISFTGGTGDQLPDDLTFIITIGMPPPNGIKDDAVYRYYEIIRSGGSAPTRFNLSLRYLPSELNGNDQSKMVFWDHHVPYDGTSPHEHGVSFHNTVDNYMVLASHGIGYLVEGEYTGEISFQPEMQQNQAKLWLFADRETDSGDDIFVWIGPKEDGPKNDWDNDTNWADNCSPKNAAEGNCATPAIPYQNQRIFIQAAPNLPTENVPSHLVLRSLYIEQGGTFDAAAAGVHSITVHGSLDENNGYVSWSNQGTFIPGTSTVTFNSANAVIAGNTNFHNLTITDDKKLSMIDGSRIGIGNEFDLNSTGVLNTTFFGNTTVEYNGAAQTVINPEFNEYSTLILSGSGAKTMPINSLNILGNFSLIGTASATAASALTINGHLTIGEDAGFNTGDFDHTLKGNFDNNGIFTAAAGQSITFNGTANQSILGDNPITFRQMEVNNPANMLCFNDLIVHEKLLLTNGIISTHNSAITITESGNITDGSATSHVSGKLARIYNNIGSKIFPIGKSGQYLPMTLNYTDLIGTSTVTAESFTGGFPGTAPVGSAQVGTRYWNVSQTGASTFTYSITLDGTGLVFDADPAVVLKYDDPNTIFYDATEDNGNYTAEGLTSFSDFALGKKTCQPPDITELPSSDPQLLCLNEKAVELSVTATGDGLNYKWFKNTTDIASGGVEVATNTNTYTPETNKTGTHYYYVVITGECGTATSTVSGEVTVNLQQFRSIASGNWTDASKWQQYTGIDDEWITATEYPGQNPNDCPDPMVTIRAGHEMEIASTDVVDIPNLKIKANGKLTIKSGGKLIIQEKLQLDEQAGAAIVVE